MRDPWRRHQGAFGRVVQQPDDPYEVDVPGTMTTLTRHHVAVGRTVVDLVHVAVVGEVPRPPIAIDRAGRALLPATGCGHELCVGPLRWVTPRPIVAVAGGDWLSPPPGRYQVVGRRCGTTVLFRARRRRYPVGVTARAEPRGLRVRVAAHRAVRAGLRAGDLITGADGAALAGLDEPALVALALEVPPEAPVRWTVEPGGRALAIESPRVVTTPMPRSAEPARASAGTAAAGSPAWRG